MSNAYREGLTTFYVYNGIHAGTVCVLAGRHSGVPRRFIRYPNGAVVADFVGIALKDFDRVGIEVCADLLERAT